MLLNKSHTLEFLLDATKKKIKIFLMPFYAPENKGAGKKGSPTQKQGSQSSTFVCLLPLLWGGRGGVRNVNGGQGGRGLSKLF